MIKAKVTLLLNLKGAVLLSLFLIAGRNVNGQAVTDSVTLAFVPALSYSSDLGIIGGGLISRYSYADDAFPFVAFSQVSAVITTKGLFSFRVTHDVPRSFGKDLRTTSTLSTSRFLQNQYYGVGTYEKLADPPAGNPDFYLYSSYASSLDLVIRKPLYRIDYKHLDLWTNINISYQSPFDNSADKLISIAPPPGFKGGLSSSIGIGMIWDGRNNEFDATSGIFARSQFNLADDLTASDFNYTIMMNEVRSYTSFFLIRDIVWANRIQLQNTTGNVPYWRLPTLGGELTLRGFAQNRFLDQNSILFNTELRTWLFDLPVLNGKIGGTLFFDAGRSYSDGDWITDAVKDLKYTFGFGGNSSFFTPDFIMRGDVGFSEDGVGVYLTAGYIF